MERFAHAHCRCGQPLDSYNYADQDRSVGQDHYDAWLADTSLANCYAASRSDVLNWRTATRPVAHDVLSMQQQVVQVGTCQGAV